MSYFALFFLFCVLYSSNSLLLGQWEDTTLQPVHEEILSSALSSYNWNSSPFSSSSIHSSLCIVQVMQVQQQVVDGMMYRYEVKGCFLERPDASMSDSCATTCENTENYEIQVYVQAASSVIRLESFKIMDHLSVSEKKKANGQVQLETTSKTLRTDVEGNDKDNEGDNGDAEAGTGTSASAEANSTDITDIPNKPYIKKEITPEEKTLIDSWIKRNHLNEFGDNEHQIYLGGTPLVDEKTQKGIDKYDYILMMHPDKPWMTQEVISWKNMMAFSIIAMILAITMVGFVFKKIIRHRMYSSERTYMPIPSSTSSRYKYERFR